MSMAQKPSAPITMGFCFSEMSALQEPLRNAIYLQVGNILVTKTYERNSLPPELPVMYRSMLTQILSCLYYYKLNRSIRSILPVKILLLVCLMAAKISSIKYSRTTLLLIIRCVTAQMARANLLPCPIRLNYSDTLCPTSLTSSAYLISSYYRSLISHISSLRS